MRTYAFRLYPNREQRRRLHACLDESRQLYNDMLTCQRQQYRQTGAFLSRYDLNTQFKGRGGASVPATTLQCLSDRLTKALQTFLLHKDNGWGFPRFKSGNQWHSIQAQTHLKIARQRRDFHFKVAKRYAGAYQTIVVEDLNIGGLARSRMAKSILDAAWGAFLTILSSKAASAGGQVIRISPRFTTQTCS